MASANSIRIGPATCLWLANRDAKCQMLDLTPVLPAELVGDDFPILHLELCSRHCLLFKTSPNDSEQHASNDSNPSQESFMEIKLTYYHQLCRAGRVFPL
jgi:hypothetical protein